MKNILKITFFSLILILNFSTFLPATAQDQTPEIKQELEQFGQTVPVAKDTPDIFVGKIIKAVLLVIGAIIILMIVYGGVTYATAAGNEEKIETAKKILVYCIIGIIIIALAYALTDFIIQALFNFSKKNP